MPGPPAQYAPAGLLIVATQRTPALQVLPAAREGFQNKRCYAHHMLYICATPIGNLGDASPRLVEILEKVQIVACEDTRRTMKLLSHFGIKGPTLISLHEHNEVHRVGELMPRLREGADVALVSDAGTPILSDPGLRLVQACHEEGIPVTAVPGPSAALAALAVSGLPADRFLFVGFLPRGRGHLKPVLDNAAAVRATLVAFESPRRVRATLAEMAALRPGCRLALCRELTKLHEEVISGSVEEVLATLPDMVRGEITLVLRPENHPGGGPREQPDVQAAVASSVQQQLQNGMSTRSIADSVAEMAGLSRSAAYELVLTMKALAPPDAERGQEECGS